MKLANASDQIHAAGAEIMAVSVDSDERQAAMFERWPAPNVLFVSDPGGEKILKPMGMFNPDDRDGIALPGLFVLDTEGNEVFAYRGRDFADRTNDDDVIAALTGLGLPAIDAPAGGPVVEGASVKGAFGPAAFVPYFKGNRFGAAAIQSRAEGDEAKMLAREHREMCDSMLEAWSAVST